MFPELCTLHQQAPAVHDDSLRRRHVDERKSAQQQPPQQAVVNKAAPTQIAQQEPSRFARTMSRWKRWTLVLVVFVYLILSKIASRSAGGGE
ncbi:hypothetical protein BC940DRAFT_271941 [Gongronella butleri]|nr:hypothetical protein BC940DRAFT_271941 [Gongronella butleri]